MPIHPNRAYLARAFGRPPSSGALEFHRGLPGYARTPLIEIPEAARALGVGRLLVKDESFRLGLPAFKILGASWAIHAEIRERTGAPAGVWRDEAERARVARSAGLRALVAATDGNHGRSVARVARWLGLPATICVPRGTVDARIAAIEGEGADVEGYATLFLEVDEQLASRGAPTVDLVLVQVGVGSLAAAAVRHYRAAGREALATVIGVEPRTAACAGASFAAGRPVSVPGPHASIMAGLNCGTLSCVAWPRLRRGMAAGVTVDDVLAERAMRDLAAAGLRSGESGAAGLAGLLELAGSEHARSWRTSVGVGADAVALILSTEGITDPERYRSIVG